MYGQRRNRSGALLGTKEEMVKGSREEIALDRSMMKLRMRSSYSSGFGFIPTADASQGGMSKPIKNSELPPKVPNGKIGIGKNKGDKVGC
jgi:hypothetical protein